MNRFAYLASEQVIALMQALSNVHVTIHGRENIPDGSLIFVVNHFTRIETFLLPYQIYQLTHRPVWSLANPKMFNAGFDQLLEAIGAVSINVPHRDRLIVKNLLTGEADWIIYPEGCMVKDKQIVEHARYMVSCAGGRRAPHSGAATLALRTEFYRHRLRRLVLEHPEEAEHLCRMFDIDDLTPVLAGKTSIVPVNITYYPLRARENALSRLADIFLSGLADRYYEELLIEGAMVLDGVDIDIRFAPPLEPGPCLSCGPIEEDIASAERIAFDDRLPSRQAMRHEAHRLMQSYMAGIYEHTTVNHDHLFASLLRALPFNTFTEEGFRRRAYLLADNLASSKLFRHQSLESGQVSLLTDDRHHKIREFIELAVETGVVRRQGGVLLRDAATFSSPLSLDRARVDNPIGVIANEVLPLKVLQREAVVSAWLPAPLVRRLVYKRLLRRADEEFEADYRTFFRTGESKEREIGRPYLLKGGSNELGVVLAHGFLSAPRELVELARHLAGRGHWVRVVRLKGHGTSPQDLALRNADDWRESIDSGYAALSLVCKKVVVIGFSFGGGLALDCALRNRQTAAVVAVCPPLWLRDFYARFAPSLAIWNRLMSAMHFEKGKREFAEIVSEHPEINYRRIPVSALAILESFMEDLERELPKITNPALVIQSQGDAVVDPQGSQLLYERLGSKHKAFRMFEFPRHNILSGDGAETVYAVIDEFLETIG